MSHGNFVYGESKYNGYALVHVTKGKVDVKLVGVDFKKGLPAKPAPAKAEQKPKKHHKRHHKKHKKHHKKAKTIPV